jgi:hypothetical protein
MSNTRNFGFMWAKVAKIFWFFLFDRNMNSPPLFITQIIFISVKKQFNR